MNANQARAITDGVRRLKSPDRRYKEIISRITIFAKKGESFMWQYQVLPDITKEKLVSDGYVLSNESFDRNEYSLKISW